MIWTRRVLATVLVPVFASAFLVTSAVFGVNGTLLSPDFYTDTLRRLNVVDEFYDETLPALIERAELDVSGVPLGLDLSPEGIAAKIKRVITPEWLEANLVAAADEALPYFVGDKNRFRVSVELASRVEALAAAVPDLLQEAELYDYVLDEGLFHVIEGRRHAFQSLLPFGVVLTTDDVMQGLRMLIPESWLLKQVRAALDEMVPYVTGDKESFRVVVSLKGRAPVVEEVLEGWFARSLDWSARDYLFQEHIVPIASGYLKRETRLSFGVIVTAQEILAALGTGLPSEWVQARVDEATAVMGPYLAGQTGAFSLSIPMEEVVSAAAASLAAVADARVQAIYNALPRCASDQVSALSSNVDVAPHCRPPRVTYEHFKIFVALDLRAELERALARQLPATIRLTHHELFTARPGTPAASVLADVRRYLRDSYTFRRLELRHLLEEMEEAEDKPPSGERERPVWERFEDVRRHLRGGFTITQDDLRESGNDAKAFDRFEKSRRLLGTARRMLFLLIVMLVAVSALIGFLGGRSRGTRLIWAAVPVLLGGLVVVAFIGVADGPLRSLGADVIQGVDPTGLFTTKLLEVRDALVDAFFGRLLAQGVIAGFVALVLIAGGIAMDRRGSSTVVMKKS